MYKNDKKNVECKKLKRIQKLTQKILKIKNIFILQVSFKHLHQKFSLKTSQTAICNSIPSNSRTLFDISTLRHQTNLFERFSLETFLLSYEIKNSLTSIDSNLIQFSHFLFQFFLLLKPIDKLSIKKFKFVIK